MFPYLLLFENFKRLDGDDEGRKKTSKMLLNIYFGMMMLGPAIVIPLVKWFLEDLNMNWAGSMLTFTLINMFTGVLVCAFISEQFIKKEEEEEKKTLCQNICKIF